MLRSLPLVAALVIVLAGPGCARVLPVHDVRGAPVVTSSAKALTLEQVRDVITAAAQSKRWRVQQIEDGHMVATVRVRKHTASVDIHYSATGYDITYKDSQSLLYDGRNIHRNYNKWVKLLDDKISRDLNAL